MRRSKIAFRKRIIDKHSSQEISILPFKAYQPMPAVRTKKNPPMISRTMKRATATGMKRTKTASSHGLMLRAKAEGGPEMAGIAGPGINTIAEK